MTQVENSRLAGAGERAPALSRGWDPRVRILARLLEGLRYGSLSVTLPSGQKFVRVRRRTRPRSECRPAPVAGASAPVHRRRHRLCPGVDRRRLLEPGLDRAHPACGAQPPRARRRRQGFVFRPVGLPPSASLERQHQARKRAQHHRPLRSRQRLFPALARRRRWSTHPVSGTARRRPSKPPNRGRSSAFSTCSISGAASGSWRLVVAGGHWPCAWRKPAPPTLPV